MISWKCINVKNDHFCFRDIIFEKNDVAGGPPGSRGSQKCQKCKKCIFAQNLYGLTGAKMTPFGKNAKIVTIYLWDALRNGALIREKTRKRHLLVRKLTKVKKVTFRGSKNDPRGIQKWSKMIIFEKCEKCKNTKTTSNPFSDYPHRCIIRACMCIHVLYYIYYI